MLGAEELEALSALDDQGRAAALDVLDRISRPMTVRELDRALAGHLTRSQRNPLLLRLKHFKIIALVGPE